MSQGGENIQSLQKMLDFVRMGSIALLILHIYCTCYPAMQSFGITHPISDRLIYNITHHIPLLGGINKPKVAVLILLGISLIGVKGRKEEKLTPGPIIYFITIGLVLFFLSSLFLLISLDAVNMFLLYTSITVTGYLSITAGGNRISRLLRLKFQDDIFNDLNESFPQEERLIENEYSVSLPAQYNFRGQTRHSYINLCNIFRGTIVAGTPGSGKSFYVYRNLISQLAKKAFCFALYDLKFPDLSTLLYNHVLNNKDKYPVAPKFYIINFDDLTRTHRCNVLSPETMIDITDATESSRTLMMALNRSWLQKNGDFFVESACNFVTAIFWYLRKYEDGKYCTLPHAIELAQVEYKKLFPILSLEPDIENLIGVFISAYLNNALEQLEGQIASAKIGLARLISPAIYYVLSGNDFTLDINNPQDPKVLCLGSNPSKSATYGAVLSLYVERMQKLILKKNQRPCALLYDEYASLTASVDLISIARGYLIGVVIGLQDVSQLTRDYGKEQAEVIINICGNIISGQVLGESAKTMSDRIGRINQEKESLSINANDTSLSKSTQLDNAVPVSRISNLSSGEFVGAVADTPQQPIKNKVFYNRIVNDLETLKREDASFKTLPVVNNIDASIPMQNFYQIKADIKNLVEKEIGKIQGSGNKQPVKDPATGNGSPTASF